MGRGGRHTSSHCTCSATDGISAGDARRVVDAAYASHDPLQPQPSADTEEGDESALPNGAAAGEANSWWSVVEACVSDVCFTIEDRFIIPQNVFSVPPLQHEEDEEEHTSVAALIGYFTSVATLLAFAAYSRRLSNLMNGASPVMGEILFCVSHLAQVTQEQLGWSLFCSGFLSPSNFDWAAADCSGVSVGGINGLNSAAAAGSQAARRQMSSGGAMGKGGGGGGVNNAGGGAGGSGAGYASYSGGNVMRYLLGRKASSAQRQEPLRSYLYRSFYSPSAFLVEQTCWFVLLITTLDTVTVQRVAVATFFGNVVGWVPVYSIGALTTLAAASLFVFMYWIPSYEIDDSVLSVMFLQVSVHRIMSAYCASLCITLLFAESMLFEDLRRSFVASIFSLPQRVLRLSGNYPVVAWGLRACGEMRRNYFYFVDFYFFLGMMFWLSLVLMETAAGISILGIVTLLMAPPWVLGCGWMTTPARALKDTIIYMSFYVAAATVIATIVPASGIPFLSNAVQAGAVLLFMAARCEYKQPNGCAYVLIWIFMLAVYAYEKFGAGRGASVSKVWGPHEMASRTHASSAVQIVLQDSTGTDAEAMSVVRIVCLTLWQVLSKGLSEEGAYALHFNVVVLGSMLILSTSIRAVALEGIGLSDDSTDTYETTTAVYHSPAFNPVPSNSAASSVTVLSSARTAAAASATNVVSKAKSGSSSAHNPKASSTDSKLPNRPNRQEARHASASNLDSGDALSPETTVSSALPVAAEEEDEEGEKSMSPVPLKEDEGVAEKDIAITFMTTVTETTSTTDAAEEELAPGAADKENEGEEEKSKETHFSAFVVFEGESLKVEEIKAEGKETSDVDVEAAAMEAEEMVETNDQQQKRSFPPLSKACMPKPPEEEMAKTTEAAAPLAEADEERLSTESAAAEETVGGSDSTEAAAAAAETETKIVEERTIKVLVDVNDVLENASLTSHVSPSNESFISLSNPDNGKATTMAESKTSQSSFSTEDSKKKSRRQREWERKKSQQELKRANAQAEAEAAKVAKAPPAETSVKTPVDVEPATVVSVTTPVLPLPRSQTEGLKKIACAASPEAMKVVSPTKTEKKGGAGETASSASTNASKAITTAVESAKATRNNKDRRKDNTVAGRTAVENKNQEKAGMANGKSKISTSSSLSVATTTTSKDTANENGIAGDNSTRASMSTATVAPFPLPKPRHEHEVPAKAAAASVVSATTPAVPLTAAEKLRRSANTAAPSKKEARTESSPVNKSASQIPTAAESVPASAPTSAIAASTTTATTAVPQPPSVPLPRSVQSKEAEAKKESQNRKLEHSDTESKVDATAVAAVESEKTGSSKKTRCEARKVSNSPPLSADVSGTEKTSVTEAKWVSAAPAATLAEKGVWNTKATQPAEAVVLQSSSGVLKVHSPTAADDTDESYDLDRVLNFLKLKVISTEDMEERSNSDDSNRSGYQGEAFFNPETPTTHAADTPYRAALAQGAPVRDDDSIGRFSTLLSIPQCSSEWTAKASDNMNGNVTSGSFGSASVVPPSGGFHVFSTHPQVAAAVAAGNGPMGSSGQQMLSPIMSSQQRPASPNAGVTMHGHGLLHTMRSSERDGVMSDMTLQPKYGMGSMPPTGYHPMARQTPPTPILEQRSQQQQQQHYPFNIAAMNQQHHNADNTYSSSNRSASNSTPNGKSMAYITVGNASSDGGGGSGGGSDRQQPVLAHLCAVANANGAAKEQMVVPPSPPLGSGMHKLQGHLTPVPGAGMSPPMMLIMNAEGHMTLVPVMYNQPGYVIDSNGIMHQAQGPPPTQIVYTAMPLAGQVRRQQNVVAYQMPQEGMYGPASPPHGHQQGMSQYPQSPQQPY